MAALTAQLESPLAPLDGDEDPFLELDPGYVDRCALWLHENLAWHEVRRWAWWVARRRYGICIRRVARPTSAFWEAWRQRKEEMKRFGVQVYQTEWALRQRYPVADSQLPYSVSWTEKMLTPVLQPEEAAVDPVSAPLGASGAAQPAPEPWHTWYSLALDISRALGRIQFKAAPTPLWRTCYPHQQSAVEFSLRRWATGRRGAIIGLEQGLGKTLTTLACLEQMQLHVARPLRVLLVGPARINGAWARDIHHFQLEQSFCLVPWPPGTSPQSPGVGVAQLTPVSYERLRQPAQLVRAQQEEWDVIVCDECHRIKHQDSQTSRAIQLLTRAALFAIGLSGTAWHNRFESLWSQGAVLEPALHLPPACADSEQAWRQAYRSWRRSWAGVDAPRDHGVDGRILTGFSHVNATWMHTVTKLDVEGVHLPPATDHWHRILMDPQQRAQYEEVCDLSVGALPAQSGQISQRQRIAILGALHKVRQWCGLQKEAAFRALLPTLRLPLLVFTCYAVEQAWLERVVRAAGLRYGEISARPGLPFTPARRAGTPAGDAGRHRCVWHRHQCGLRRAGPVPGRHLGVDQQRLFQRQLGAGTRAYPPHRPDPAGRVSLPGADRRLRLRHLVQRHEPHAHPGRIPGQPTQPGGTAAGPDSRGLTARTVSRGRGAFPLGGRCLRFHPAAVVPAVLIWPAGPPAWAKPHRGRPGCARKVEAAAVPHCSCT